MENNVGLEKTRREEATDDLRYIKHRCRNGVASSTSEAPFEEFLKSLIFIRLIFVLYLIHSFTISQDPYITKMYLNIFCCAFRISVTKLPSWNVSVEAGMVSAEITWSDFPSNVSIEELFVTYTLANENVSVLLPVESVDEMSYHMDSLLMPNSEYTFEVYAFTGGIEDDIYSSASVTVTTKEGGRLPHK